MYAPSRIAWRLEEARKQHGFLPVRHSPEEVDQFERHLRDHNKYLLDDKGNPIGTQNLSPDESRWILNEIILCTCDAHYALTRYVFLIDRQGVVMRFVPRVAQEILFGIIADLEERGYSIEIMVLKARQLGITSLIQPLIGLRIFFGYGVNAVAGSADRQKTALMASKMFMCYDMFPVWLRPQHTQRAQSEQGGKLVFGGSLSGVSFQHGAQMSGIARGHTPTVYHLSEVASFINAKDQIEASLFKCVHPSPSVFGVLESTGEGDTGWWADTWRISSKRWQQGRARLCPLFLPWYVGTDLY